MIARYFIALLTGLMLLNGAARALPATVAPAHIAHQVPGARLAGAGTFRWYGLKIYDAQLWVGDKGYSPSAPQVAPFALELTYARALVGKKIAESSADEMKKLGYGSAEQRTAWLVKMRALFPDVQEGTCITGIFLPAGSARFFLDGKPLGEIVDSEFATAFFAIWLDPKTTGGKLRDALLQDAAAR